jgi:amino acid adenylation domain-containing protein/thioester reductase-like protein
MKMSDTNCYELTYPQKSICMAETFYPNANFTTLSAWLRLNEEVNYDFLEKALNIAVSNNDSFRIRFINENGVIKQYIEDYKYFAIDVINIDSISDLENLMRSIKFSMTSECICKYGFFREKNNNGGFYFVLNHALADAWAMVLLNEEILKIYSSLLKNEEPSGLRSSSFVDIINSENEYLNSDKFIKDKSYWEEKFSTPCEIVNFKKGNLFDLKSNRETFFIDPYIKEFCNNSKISPFCLFSAAISIYLSRIANSSEIVIGNDVLNRTNFIEKNTTGMCIFVSPIRQKINENLTLNEFLVTVFNNQFELIRHQRYPFEKVQEYYSNKFGNSLPLYDVILSYHNAKTHLEGIDVEFETNWLSPGTQTTSLVYHLSDTDNTGNIKLSIDYLINSFTEKDISRMYDSIIYIISQFVSNGNMLIRDVEIVPTIEKDRLLSAFQGEKVNIDEKTTIAMLFEKQVILTPNNIALIFEDKSITYSELNNKVNSLAKILKNNNLNNNDIVGIMQNRSFEMIICMLAILKAGCAYLPIDPTYPQKRIQYILDDSKCSLLLTSSSIETNYIEIPKIFVSMDSLISDDDFKDCSRPENLAYIIYTSGSTGNPKGVMINNENIVNTLLWRKNTYLFNEKITVLQIPSFSFDSSVEDIFTPLISGSKLVLSNHNNTSLNLNAIKDLIIKHNVNHFLVVPSFYNVILSEIPDALKTFKSVTIAGEAFSIELVNKHFELLPNVDLYNEYGPTENSVCSTYYKFNNLDKEVVIGKPINNCNCYILNKSLKMQPVNVQGELYVSGPGLAKGYLYRSELTSERFIPNPFSNTKSLMYKTGDIVRITENNYIEFIQRDDHQIKYNGFRINLGEIESIISKELDNPNVVVLLNKFNNTLSLDAYIETSEKIDVELLKNNIKSFLPYYMMPKHFIVIDSFPKTPNGKIDRDILIKIASDNIRTNIVDPRNELDSLILNIWKIVLKKDNIGIEDNLFDLGGDSLSILSIQSLLFKNGIHIKVQDLFDCPNVRQVSDKVNQKSDEKHYEKDEIASRIYNDNPNLAHSIKFCFKNVLLTGVTGFLGSHILNDLLVNTKCNIYCVIRKKSAIDIYSRFKETLNYYFNGNFSNLINKRIFLLEGDLTKQNLGLSEQDYIDMSTKIDTIINCASLVKHYGDYKLFYQNNVETTKNIVDFCTRFDILLNHISTISVSGNYLVSNNLNFNYTENDFYIGQNYMDNVYVRTKFEAENLIFKAQEDGLNANIFRVGNIMPRLTDGKFQSNFSDNAYFNRIYGFIKLGKLPSNLIGQVLEFTPVDSCANAIVKLLPYKNKVFHLLNTNTIDISKLVESITNLGYKIKFIPDDEFYNYIKSYNTELALNKLISDFDSKQTLDYKSTISISTNITDLYLAKNKFKWPNINKKYLKNFIKKMEGDSYFKKVK